HAFPGGRSGALEVMLERVPERRLRLTIKDDGVGLGRAFPAEPSPTLGLDLVGIFAKQLQAELEVDRASGTCFRLTFSEISV
ncbi:MAG TPA: hypothetical protein VEQ59_12410, partial [Polyangiaceae bacterium]|nr:hypothetical protein [Polyangiaceae bacterium]